MIDHENYFSAADIPGVVPFKTNSQEQRRSIIGNGKIGRFVEQRGLSKGERHDNTNERNWSYGRLSRGLNSGSIDNTDWRILDNDTDNHRPERINTDLRTKHGDEWNNYGNRGGMNTERISASENTNWRIKHDDCDNDNCVSHVGSCNNTDWRSKLDVRNNENSGSHVGSSDNTNWRIKRNNCNHDNRDLNIGSSDNTDWRRKDNETDYNLRSRSNDTI